MARNDWPIYAVAHTRMTRMLAILFAFIAKVHLHVVTQQVPTTTLCVRQSQIVGNWRFASLNMPLISSTRGIPRTTQVRGQNKNPRGAHNL